MQSHNNAGTLNQQFISNIEIVVLLYDKQIVDTQWVNRADS